MAKLFMPNESGQPSFVNSDFDKMRRLLDLMGKTEWSRRPRTYAVLNMIGRLEIFDAFLLDGLTDIAFPYTSAQLPGSLTPGTRKRFLEMQSLVLTKASDRELFSGRHIHFGKCLALAIDQIFGFESLAYKNVAESADVHFDFIKLLGRGCFGVVDHVISKLSLEEYAVRKIPCITGLLLTIHEEEANEPKKNISTGRTSAKAI
jgi:hypothetical protein